MKFAVILTIFLRQNLHHLYVITNNLNQHQDKHVEPEVYDYVPSSIVESPATQSEATPHIGNAQLSVVLNMQYAIHLIV